jgi:cell wall assembly regulator SMI1
MQSIEKELARLVSAFAKIGTPIVRAAPATDQSINRIAEVSTIEAPAELLDLWRFSNGSSAQSWFLLGEGDDDIDSLTPLQLKSVEASIRFWSLFLPYDQKLYDEWYDDESWGKRDSRIQRHFLRHKAWFPFADFNGGSTLLQIDLDPTTAGRSGQIIQFVHDPDGVFWVADDFLTFFRKSNSLFERFAEEDPGALAELVAS